MGLQKYIKQVNHYYSFAIIMIKTAFIRIQIRGKNI
jgi:hypothetical protein